MPTLNDLAGRAFGRLSVIKRDGVAKNGKAKWLCACLCGASVTVVGSELLSGHTKSCGCLRAERNRISSLEHGKHNSPAYRSWLSMKTRCTNQRVASFADYGGRGVVVCERWAGSFSAFLEDMGERPPGTTLDRWPDTNGNYEPSNCRWATRVQQQRNTTTNKRITFRSETLTLTEWAERTGINKSTLSYRLRAGWATEKALMARNVASKAQR